MIFQKSVPCLDLISPPVSSQRQVSSIYLDPVSHTNLLYTFSAYSFPDTYVKCFLIYFSYRQYSVRFLDTFSLPFEVFWGWGDGGRSNSDLF